MGDEFTEELGKIQILWEKICPASSVWLFSTFCIEWNDNIAHNLIDIWGVFEICPFLFGRKSQRNWFQEEDLGKSYRPKVAYGPWLHFGHIRMPKNPIIFFFHLRIFYKISLLPLFYYLLIVNPE